jgi:hypothetical protein
MPWSRKFPTSIKLKDGRKILTIGEARDLMSSLADGRQNDPAWQFAVELLQYSSTRVDATPAGQARAQLVRVLKADGLI